MFSVDLCSNLIMAKFILHIVVFLYYNHVFILAKTFDRLRNCDNSSISFKNFYVPIPESLDILTTNHDIDKIFCRNCKEEIISVGDENTIKIRRFHFNVVRNFGTTDIPLITFVILPEHQIYQEQITIRVSLTDNLSSNSLCVMTRWNQIPTSCDANFKFPITTQGNEFTTVSYVISIDSRKRWISFTTLVQDKIEHNYHTRFNFSLDSYKISFSPLHTLAESIYTSIKMNSSVHDTNEIKVQSYSPQRIDSCTGQKPYCSFIPKCLDGQSCRYEQSNSFPRQLKHQKEIQKEGFIYSIETIFGIRTVKIDLVGKSGSIRFLSNNGEILDTIRVSGNVNQNQFDIYFNPKDDFESDSFAAYRISNPCPIFTILLIFSNDEPCSNDIEPPYIAIILEKRITMLGRMSANFDTLSAIGVEGDLKVLNAEASLNESKCRITHSTSLTVVIIASVIIIFLIVVPVTLFAKRIQKDNKKKMLFMINTTISHHADKEYSKANEKQSVEREEKEIIFESVQENIYYDECEEYTPPRIIYKKKH